MRGMTPCPLCMSLRAKFVRWLGIRLGVMEPIKEKKMEQPTEGLSQLEVFAVIGQLRLQVELKDKQILILQARVRELETTGEKPALAVVS